MGKCAFVYRYITQGWPQQTRTSFAPYLRKKSELTVEGGCVVWGLRVVIPDSCRGRLLSELHRDHPGICKMKSIARSYIWWPVMDDGIEKLAKSCQDCHAVKNAPPVAPLHPWEWPSRVFQRCTLIMRDPFREQCSWWLLCLFKVAYGSCHAVYHYIQDD